MDTMRVLTLWLPRVWGLGAVRMMAAPAREWEFVVTDGEYGGLTVRGNSEPRFTSSDQPGGSLSLARPWAEALMGRTMALGEEADTDDFIGLPVQGTVRHLEPRQKKDSEGFWFNVEIDELFPAGWAAARRLLPLTHGVPPPLANLPSEQLLHLPVCPQDPGREP
jgi:hypothetical protein